MVLAQSAHRCALLSSDDSGLSAVAQLIEHREDRALRFASRFHEARQMDRCHWNHGLLNLTASYRLLLSRE